MNLRELREVGRDILAKERVDTADLERLRTAVYAAGKPSREAADLVVDIRKRLTRPAGPEVRKFVKRVVIDHVLADGKVGAEEAGWLRQMVYADGVVQDEERTLLRELKGEATAHSPEFDALFAEVDATPPEVRTSGSGRDAEHGRRK